MEKSATLNMRVNPQLKRQAEEILDQLEIPMSVAINMYLKQIVLTGSIPFSVTLPKAPDNINADIMTTEQISAKLQEGYSEIEEGKTCNVAEAFAEFRGKHK